MLFTMYMDLIIWLVDFNKYWLILLINLNWVGFSNVFDVWTYTYPTNVTFHFAWKFLISIGFLILIRGGTPRYRYDYLSKLGWLKFLGFTVGMLILIILFYYIF